MRKGRVLPWRPRNPSWPTTQEAIQPPLVWTLMKGETQIDCFVECTAPMASICWVVNRQWSFRSLFVRPADAAAAATQKYEELRATGWTAISAN